MYKVQWNKKHTWKILKYYKEGKINKILFEGLWYRPVVNRNSFERDEFGNQYIACDGCDDCALVDVCHESNTDNPIGDACEWIKENFECYVGADVSPYYIYVDEFVEDFRKAMED